MIWLLKHIAAFLLIAGVGITASWIADGLYYTFVGRHLY